MITLIYILYTIVALFAGIIIKYNNTFVVYLGPIIKFSSIEKSRIYCTHLKNNGFFYNIAIYKFLT